MHAESQLVEAMLDVRIESTQRRVYVYQTTLEILESHVIHVSWENSVYKISKITKKKKQ